MHALRTRAYIHTRARTHTTFPFTTPHKRTSEWNHLFGARRGGRGQDGGRGRTFCWGSRSRCKFPVKKYQSSNQAVIPFWSLFEDPNEVAIPLQVFSKFPIKLQFSFEVVLKFTIKLRVAFRRFFEVIDKTAIHLWNICLAFSFLKFFSPIIVQGHECPFEAISKFPIKLWSPFEVS